MSLHRQLLQDASDLFQRWHLRRDVPRFDRPRLHEWQPPDGSNANVAIAWSGNCCSSRLIKSANQVITRSCANESDLWIRQYVSSTEFIASFFGPSRRPSALNLVTVTPSRLPRHKWPLFGRPVLHESQSFVSRYASPDAPLIAKSLADAPPIHVNRLRWAPRPAASRDHLRIAVVKAQRNNEGTGITYTRAFLYDRLLDADAVMDGHVPAVSETVDLADGGIRVNSPMVQYWRFFANGSVEVINFGLSRRSGLLTDVRWTRSSLDTIMIQAPEFARPMLELDRVGVILRRA